MKKLVILTLLSLAMLSVSGCLYYYGYGYADPELAVSVGPAPAVYVNPPAVRYYWGPWVSPSVEYRYYHPSTRLYIDRDRYYHAPSRTIHPTRRVEVRH